MEKILTMNFPKLILEGDIICEKELKKLRDTFIATLSHDLKTPTIAQIRSLELLMNGKFGALNQEQSEMINLTLESCKYMYDMVENLLLVYKYESGEMQLSFKDFDIEMLVKECCDKTKKLAQGKNITIRINQENLKTNVIRADRIQTKKAITNMLLNSLAYSYENSEILITLGNSCSGDFVFQLKNVSPYIDNELLELLFEKYATDASKYNRVGDGLGLYLAKQIILAHQGEIIARCYPNEESILGFRLKSSSNLCYHL